MAIVKETFKRIYTIQGLLFIIVAAALLEATALTQYHFTKKGLREEANRRAENVLTINRLEVENVTGALEAGVNNIAWALEDKLDQPDQIFPLLYRMMGANPDIVSTFVGYAPDYYPEKGHWFEPALSRRGSGKFEELILGSESHDYFQTDWYKKAVETESGYWSEPYQDDEGSLTMVVTYATPVRDGEGRIVGVAGADISLAFLSEVIDDIQLYPDSFGTISSQDGQLLACPAETLAVADALRYDTLLDNTGWKMSVVIPEDEIYSTVNRLSLGIALMQLLGLLLLALIIQRSAVSLKRLKDVSEGKKKIENELHIASSIQQAMLPKTFPPYPDRGDIDIFASLKPAKEVGGDIFDYYIRDERLFFCIGDVSGKGVPAALVMAVTKSLFRNVSGHESNPGRIVTQMNDSMAESNESVMFVTFFVGVLDLADGQLRYCNAGHNAPLVLDGAKARPLKVVPNVPLGVVKDKRFKQQEATLPAGATLFLFTDGLTEAEDARHELYGEERLEKAAAEAGSLSAREQVDLISASVQKHVRDAAQSDDLTMLSIKYLGNPNISDRHLLLHNDIQQIPQLADFIETIAKESGISQSLAMSLNLALEEAVTNVILYAYPEGTDGLVDVEAIIRKDSIHFRISDSGRSFDPTQVAPVDIDRPLEDRPVGGLGIHLVRSIMDQVSYERKDDRNILKLVKKL
ncbi:MAG: SpoIIE family protein phosphatase [Bacteroidales bacterium]|nr:SpoIIE family protein phosphatase [Bacteroidales bacterium]